MQCWGKRGKVGEWRERGGKLVRQERKGCSGQRIVSLMTDVTAVCCCRSEWDGGWGLPGGVQPPSPPSGLRGESAMLGLHADNRCLLKDINRTCLVFEDPAQLSHCE